MNTSNIAEIATALRYSNLLPNLPSDDSRLFIEALRLVTKGHPVSSVQIEQIAASLQMPLNLAILLLSKVSEKNEEGDIIGTFGLSQKRHPHRFEVNGKTLFTWCAWDALFLPALLGQTADVVTLCPATNEIIRVRITPENVEKVVPSSSVISIAIPKETGISFQDAGEIRMGFCRLVHFFVSKEAASQWAVETDADVQVLSVADGYDLGRMVFAELLETANNITS